MAVKKVRIMERVGNPGSGVILQPGTTIDLPEVWADRYIAQGKAELVGGSKSKSADTAADASDAKAKAPKGKGK